MKRVKTVSIAQVICEYLGNKKLTDKLDEARIIAAWHEELGFSKQTNEIYIKNKVLFVNLSSSILRNELYMMRSTLVQRLNEKVGKNVINDVIFR